MNFIGLGKSQAETLKFLQATYNLGEEERVTLSQSKLLKPIDKIGVLSDIRSIAQLQNAEAGGKISISRSGVKNLGLDNGDLSFYHKLKLSTLKSQLKLKEAKTLAADLKKIAGELLAKEEEELQAKEGEEDDEEEEEDDEEEDEEEGEEEVEEEEDDDE